MAKEPSRSEVRTLKTKAQEGLRIAKQNLDGIAMIRDKHVRGTPEYKTAAECYAVVQTTYDQQKAVVENLNARQREVGSYKSRKKKGAKDAASNPPA